MIRLRRLVLSFGLLGMLSGLTGCGAFRGIEQWKCDNWGMCHFAPNRPGVYSPMSVQPTAGVPMGYYGAGAVAPTVYPQGTYSQGEALWYPVVVFPVACRVEAIVRLATSNLV